MKKILLLTSILLFAIIIKSQDTNSFYTNSKGFSHHLNDYEKQLMQNYTRNFVETAPPSGTVRNIAEWEPIQSVIIAYDDAFGLPSSLFKNLLTYTKITFLVANLTQENTVKNILTNAQANVNNAIFIYHDVDSWWSRDFSPWFIAIDNQQVAIVDFPYNRPRPNDDETPKIIGQNLGLTVYGMKINHTGGNYMCDGMGKAASTKLVLTENSTQSETQINTKVQNYLGIETYFKFDDPLDDYIEHIDCWGKFLDVDKVLITQVPNTDYRYADFEAIAQYFAQTNCSYGYPYKVYRVQAAASNQNQVNPYTNSLIANGKIFVPQSGSTYDAAALLVYQQAMPGYEIIGVTYSGWYNTDALHCRTYGIANTKMLYISHMPLFDTITTQTSVDVTTQVYSYGGYQLASDFPKLYYKINDSAYHTVVMTQTRTNEYSAQIPAYNGVNKISYYIEAQDEQNFVAKKPIMAQQDPFVFYTNKLPNSIAENNFVAENIKVFPNPCNYLAFVKINVEKQQNVKISIINSNGQLISSFEQNVMPGDIVNLSSLNLKSGVYIVNVQTNNGKYFEKLIVN